MNIPLDTLSTYTEIHYNAIVQRDSTGKRYQNLKQKHDGTWLLINDDCLQYHEINIRTKDRDGISLKVKDLVNISSVLFADMIIHHAPAVKMDELVDSIANRADVYEDEFEKAMKYDIKPEPVEDPVVDIEDPFKALFNRDHNQRIKSWANVPSEVTKTTVSPRKERVDAVNAIAVLLSKEELDHPNGDELLEELNLVYTLFNALPKKYKRIWRDSHGNWRAGTGERSEYDITFYFNPISLVCESIAPGLGSSIVIER